jgi:CRISPR system Cascade subunit CasD
MQAWGTETSRFVERQTRHEPTKSAVLGLIAAAQGRRRSDSIEDLLKLQFGVRIDQPGVVIRDFHTTHNAKGQATPLTNRYYLCDAIFTVGLSADRPLLEGLAEALDHPVFPLFLGRRSCVPSGKLVQGIVDDDLVTALHNHPWQAAPWYRDKQRRQGAPVRLPIVRDRLSYDQLPRSLETVRDVPLDFSPFHRDYGWRDVVHDEPVSVSCGSDDHTSDFNPFLAFPGA